MLRQLVFCFFSVLLFCSKLNAQSPASNWFFGTAAGLTFTNTAPTFTPNGALTNTNCAAAISNSAGALLFYTDGQTIYNQAHQVMPNGTGLLSGNAFQPAIIVQKPSSTNLYYVFTVGGFTGNAGLYYSVVDMSLAAGSGSVVTKNVLLHAGCRDKLTVGKHCNGQDVWIVSHDYGTVPAFVSVLLTPAGITSSVISTYSIVSPLLSGIGQIKLSPNSSKLAVNSSTVTSNISFTTAYWETRVFDFNASTGSINTTSVCNIISGNTNNYLGAYLARSSGCEFSSNSRYLYYTWYSSVVKVDMCAPTPSLSTINVYVQETTSTMDTANKRAMQLAPDGRIYIALNNKSKIGIINNPNNIGGIATYTDMALPTVTCQSGLPNFPGYYFEQKPPLSFSYSVNPQQCNTASFAPGAPVCAGSGYSVTGYQWNFGEPLSGAANTSTLAMPVHTFSASGIYTVTLIRSMLCQQNDTIQQQLLIAQPSVSMAVAQNSCIATTATAVVTGGSGNYLYSWSTTSVNASTTTFTSSGNYSVTIIDIGAGGCAASTAVQVQVVNLSASAAASSVLCFGGTGTATVTATGGSGNYQFQANALPAQTNSVFINVNAGTYTVLVLDIVRQCTAVTTFTINQPTTLTSTLLSMSVSTAICQNTSYSFVCSPQGGQMPYTYQWNNGNANPLSVYSATAVGQSVISCTVTDVNNCAVVKQTTLNVLPIPIIGTTSLSVCKGTTFTLSASGSGTFTWQPGTIVAQSFTSAAQSSLVYTISSGLNGCSSQTTLPVQVAANPQISISGFSTVCEGAAVLLTANNQASYFWSGPNGFSANTQALSIQTVALNQAGVYTLSATNASQCSATATVQVNVIAAPIISISGPTLVCIGNSALLTASGATSFQWQNAVSNAAQITVSPLQTTTYTCSGTSNGCSSQASFNLQVSKCTQVDEYFENSISKVFPNPCKDFITVVNQAEILQIRIFDLVGREVISKQVHTKQIELSVIELSAGSYLMEVNTEHGTYTSKFSKLP